MQPLPLVPLPVDWEPTRATLHQYAHAVGAVARVHAIPHPKWWHISLRVTPTGLVSAAMPAPDGGRFWIRMDLSRHVTYVERSDGTAGEIRLDAELTGSKFGDALIAMVGETGLEGEYDRSRFESDEPRAYDPAHAAGFFATLSSIHSNLELHRMELGADVGPLQVWPHGFDLAFEWFGAGESQLNLGFYPAGRAYFYSNPWPFNSGFTASPLPAPAAWHTEGWEGTILYFDELLDTADPAATLLSYAKTVHELVAPTLLA